MPKFQLVSSYPLAGDQPKATDALAEGVLRGDRAQTLLGVTGSGKTMAMARVVELVQKPTLVLCHNKTLAAQLCAEFRDFFPHNAVEYFVSYFDYYQPEAYIAHTDTYIAKDSSINDEIERLRHSATQSLLTRPDTLIVASVSCIYGLGSPADYMEMAADIRVGESIDRDDFLRKLIGMQYRRNDLTLVRGTFRVRGDTLEFVGVDEELVHRIEFFGDEIDRDQRRQPAHRRVRHLQGRAQDLSGQALHHARREAAPRRHLDRERARGAAEVLQGQRQAARGAAAGAAHALRSRHAARGRLLQRRRELLGTALRAARPAPRPGRCSTSCPRTGC